MISAQLVLSFVMNCWHLSYILYVLVAVGEVEGRGNSGWRGLLGFGYWVWFGQEFLACVLGATLFIYKEKS